MPRRTKIIFIVVFVIVGAIILSLYLYKNRSGAPSTGTGTNSGYQPFLGGGSTTGDNTGTNGFAGIGDQTANPAGVEQKALLPNSKFKQITNVPIAGATFFIDNRPVIYSQNETSNNAQTPETVKVLVPENLTTKTEVPTKNKKEILPDFEPAPSIRYVERITGHINQMYLDTRVKGKVSNSTIPGIYESIFDGSASSVIYRYLETNGKTITSYLATLGTEKGEFLPSDILDVSVSPDKSRFFYLTKTQSGIAGTIRSFKDTKKTQVFNSSITEWLSQWVSEQKIYLTTKASSRVEGNLFSLNTTNGVLTKIFGGVLGLTTLSNNDGSFILYSASSASGPVLGVFDLRKRTTINLNLNSLPEKCVWGSDVYTVYCAIPNEIPGYPYPDSWYQGLVSFNDSFVKIDISTGVSKKIANSAQEIPVDATHLFLDKIEDELFFINKKDSTLWSLNLN